MKKKELKSLALKKKIVASFQVKGIVGGHTGGVMGGCITDNGCGSIDQTGGDPYKQCD